MFVFIINYTVLFWNTFRKNSNHTICLEDKLYAQTSTLWTLCAALNESSPISLRPSGLTSWTFIVNSPNLLHNYTIKCIIINIVRQRNSGRGGRAHESEHYRSYRLRGGRASTASLRTPAGGCRAYHVGEPYGGEDFEHLSASSRHL